MKLIAHEKICYLLSFFAADGDRCEDAHAIDNESMTKMKLFGHLITSYLLSFFAGEDGRCENTRDLNNEGRDPISR